MNNNSIFILEYRYGHSCHDIQIEVFNCFETAKRWVLGLIEELKEEDPNLSFEAKYPDDTEYQPGDEYQEWNQIEENCPFTQQIKVYAYGVITKEIIQ